MAQSDDIRWIASGLEDFAVLLHVHGIDDLADQLDAVRAALSPAQTVLDTFSTEHALANVRRRR
jgi:hypothetical protein